MFDNFIYSFKGEFSFLRNDYLSEFVYQGKKYASAEHAFQSAKSGDAEVQEQIRTVPTPREAKKVGNKAILIRDWDQIKIKIMKDILRAKFSEPGLKAQLLSTTDKSIEMYTKNDSFWGVTSTGGLNILGIILMEIRQELVNEKK